MKPSLEPGVVINVNEIQWTPLTDPLADVAYKRSIANARLIWGRNAQVSMVRMDPGSGSCATSILKTSSASWCAARLNRA